ncbi:glucose 1-dehydrogenase [Conexibacter stalactiti]|uniref:Glucose 1-dehydrogenase n=1 Tax=Conexibacter stalactiti TaxID=1940611 RepID=A0ABU4HVR8_9ACTN|nr:glucose 1-dehydrogenase [Conexibacter stalactiti]MDW5597426.1 glucose 1-dehydrogenase [Conexibacter stalactiti]MEC5038068.1 glucose 1-dehydrogenase [Conexibacter stalactiti]
MAASGKAGDGVLAPHAVPAGGQFDLTGRRVVVTGAARGIGRAAAEAFARHGAELVLADVLEAELEETAREIARGGRGAHPLRLDVRSDDDVRALVETVAALGGVDVVVNAAGIVHRALATEARIEDLDRLWEVNVRGLYAVTQALLPQLIARGGGKIINVGSLGSVLGLERRAAYAATKGAVRQYTQSMAVDLGQHGICVNAIAPGYVETRMTADWLTADGDRRRRLLERIPSGRFGLPSDMEGAFVFLAAPASDYVTGQIIVVDGGWSCC